MNAVNLIPGDSRSGGLSRSTSRQTLALLASLAVVLIAALLYVSAANSVTASKGQLARATANAVSWRTVATEFAPYVTASQQRTAQLAAVRQLAAGRFLWSHLLDQIAQLMPAAAALSSLQASTAGISATATSASTQPHVQLSGCAASQSTVAQAMQQLRHVDGVSDVTLSSSSDSGTGAAATGSASSATTTSSGGGCTYPVQFQISLTFAAGSTGAAAATSTNATAATSTNATAATSTKAAAQ